MTAIYHWLFVPLTLGLSIICAIMETIYYRTGDPSETHGEILMRLFGITFAIGVATGLILEFEFGTNWSNYSHFVGDIFGARAGHRRHPGLLPRKHVRVAVMFFGWNRVSRGFHLSRHLAHGRRRQSVGPLILVANSWMQYPVGCTFNIDTVRNEMTSLLGRTPRP